MEGVHSGELGGSDLTEEEKLRVDVQYGMYRRSPGWGCDVT